MLNPFASDAAVRIDLGDGLWIDLREMLSHSDYQAIQTATIHGMVAPESLWVESGQSRVRIAESPDLDAANRETMIRAIKAWNFPDGKGGIAPITPHTLGMLREDVWDRIVVAVDAQYKPVTPEDKKSVDGDVPGPPDDRGSADHVSPSP